MKFLRATRQSLPIRAGRKSSHVRFAPKATEICFAAKKREGPNGDIHFAAKNASTHRQPGGAKGCGIGLDPCHVAANELSDDREIRACRH